MKFTPFRALTSVLATALAVVAISGVMQVSQPSHAAQLASQASAPASDWQVQQWQHKSGGSELLIDMLAEPASAASLSNYWQNHIIDFLLRAQSLTAPATIYVALDTTAGSASACGTEVSGGSYARVAVTSSLANWAGTQGAGTTVASSGTSGQTSNNNAITFAAPTAGWGTIDGFCFFDASTSGNELLYAALTTNKTVNNGDAAPSFAAGALTWTISQVITPHSQIAANDDSYHVAA